MRRVAILLVALGVGFALLAGTALAGGGDWPSEVEPHGHVMLIGVDVQDIGDFWIVTFDRCVELAAGEPLHGPAHHNSVHTGTAGGSPFVQGALWKAGKAIVPLAPFGPPHWTGCDSIEQPIVLPDLGME